MILTIKEFPDELRWKLRARADESGVTLRKFLIGVLRELVESGGTDGPGESAGVKRAAGVRGVREGVSVGPGGDDRGVKRDAKAGGALDRASTDSGAVGGGVRKDQGKDAEKAERDRW